MSAPSQPYALSPELLTFRDFTRRPPGVWLWPGGREPFVRMTGATYHMLAGKPSELAALAICRVATLRRLGILLDTDAVDTHTDRLATALGLLADERPEEAAAELRRARVTAPTLTTTWLAEAFTLLRIGGFRAGRTLLHQYLARWPGDPAATALLKAHERGSWSGAQRGQVMVLAPSLTLAQALARRASDCVERIRALCGYPPTSVILIHATESGHPGGRCLRGGSPFARLIELSGSEVEDPILLAHELVHATLSSGNLAFTEGLALHVSARLAAPWDGDAASREWLAGTGDINAALEHLFLDLATQAQAFDPTGSDIPSAMGTMPRAHWLAFLGTTALVARVGLAALVNYLAWLRDPTPATVLATQEQLFELHFACALRSALGPCEANPLAP